MNLRGPILAALFTALGLSAHADPFADSFGWATTLADAARSTMKGGGARYVPIVIFETNDIHGNIGGAPSFYTLLKNEKRPHIWLDAGDWFQGSAAGDMSDGDAVIGVLNVLNPAAALIGNHDYDDGEANVKRLAGEARFPFLGSNIESARDSRRVGYVKPYVIKKVGGVKVGIFGLLTPDMPKLVDADKIRGLRFEATRGIAMQMVRDLRRQGAQIVIAVTHVGIEYYNGKLLDGIGCGDRCLAGGVPGIDFVLGGHTHTAVYPPATVADSGNRTMIVQTPGHLENVYRIVIFVDPKTGRIGSIEDDLLPLSAAAYPPDPDVSRLVDSVQSQLDRQMSLPIGSAAQELAVMRNGWYTRDESGLGEWAAQALKDFTHADIGLVNTRGLRANLPAGPLTYGDVYKVAPFRDRFETVSISGAGLRGVIERAIGRDIIFLQYAGIDYSYDARAPEGQKVKSILINGAPLDDRASYTVAVPTFVAKVEPSMKAADKAVVQTFDVYLRDVLVKAIQKSSPISAPGSGHVRAL